MGKVRTSIKTPIGEIEIEASDFKELLGYLQEVDSFINSTTGLLKSVQSTLPMPRQELAGAVESSSDGPVLVVSKDKITVKEAILLLLYAFEKPVSQQALSRSLSVSGHMATGFAPRLSELRHEGLVLREENGELRLTAKGSKLVEGSLVPKFKATGDQP